MTTAQDISGELNREAISRLRYGMEKIEHCVNQLDDEQVWWRPQEEMNSIGNLLLHLSGNLRQWVIAGVGDAEDTRDRPREFAERGALPKEEVLIQLRAVVKDACSTLTRISPEDWLATKTVQGFDVTKLHAMMNSVTHFQGHVQEIIGLTRQQLGNRYVFNWAPQTRAEGAP